MSGEGAVRRERMDVVAGVVVVVAGGLTAASQPGPVTQKRCGVTLRTRRAPKTFRVQQAVCGI